MLFFCETQVYTNCQNKTIHLFIFIFNVKEKCSFVKTLRYKLTLTSERKNNNSFLHYHNRYLCIQRIDCCQNIFVSWHTMSTWKNKNMMCSGGERGEGKGGSCKITS